MYNDIDFPSTTVGYVVGYDSLIIKTNDNGDTWEQLTVGTTDDSFECVEFIDENTGFVAGGIDNMYTTVDGGINWNAITVPSGYIYGMSFLSSAKGYICGAGGSLYKYDNGNLQALSSGTTRVLYDVYFHDENIGYIFGGFFDSNCVIKKTVDGGNTWSNIVAPNSNAVYGVCFPTSNVGYGVGWDGNIIKTVNVGDSWTELVSGSNEVLYKVFFIDENLGYVTGNNGTLLKTTDGGATWVQENISFQDDIYGVFFTNPNNGFAVGNNENILKYTNTAFVDDSYVNDLSIFPNPFKEKLVLGNNPEFKKIIFYNALGKVLFTQDLTTNTVIDTRFLLSGVYFAKIVGDNRTILRRVVKK